MKSKQPLLEYIRTIGLVSLLFGIAGLLMSQYFWFAVYFINGAFVLLAIDLRLEWQDTKTQWPRWIGGIFLVLVVAGFNHYVVFSQS